MIDKFLRDNIRGLTPVINEEQYLLLDSSQQIGYKYKVIKYIKGIDLIHTFTDYCINLNWASRIEEAYKNECQVTIEAI